MSGTGSRLRLVKFPIARVLLISNITTNHSVTVNIVIVAMHISQYRVLRPPANFASTIVGVAKRVMTSKFTKKVKGKKRNLHNCIHEICLYILSSLGHIQ